MALPGKYKELIEPGEVIIGNKTAPVTIRFHVDYESLPCLHANEVVKRVYENNPGMINLNLRHFPLSNKHQKAMKAAEAAVAAAQEGKLWEMHNKLFQHRKHLGLISLKKYAKEIGITNKKFFEELINGKYAWAVRGDLLDALDKGIRDVPAIVVNNHLYEQEISVENLEKFVADVMRSENNGFNQ